MAIDIKKVSTLANLPLSEEEEKKFEKQLESVLDYFDQLKKVNTKNVEETSQVTGMENILRENEAKPSLPQEKALKNTKSVQNGVFKVKAILE